MKTNVFTTTLVALVLFAATAAATTVPGFQDELRSPELTTPEVSPVGATTPEVGTPATCEEDWCTEDSHTGPISVPENDFGCWPNEDNQLLCARNDEVPISEGETIPAVCTTASAACQDGTVLVPEEDHETPGVEPITVLAEGHVRLQYGVDDTTVEDPSVQIGTIQDIEISVGPVHFKVCQTPCPHPEITGGDVTSGVTFILVVGDDEYGGYFPLVP